VEREIRRRKGRSGSYMSLYMHIEERMLAKWGSSVLWFPNELRNTHIAPSDGNEINAVGGSSSTPAESEST
jgi:hypothetical protein